MSSGCRVYLDYSLAGYRHPPSRCYSEHIVHVRDGVSIATLPAMPTKKLSAVDALAEVTRVVRVPQDLAPRLQALRAKVSTKAGMEISMPAIVKELMVKGLDQWEVELGRE